MKTAREYAAAFCDFDFRGTGIVDLERLETAFALAQSEARAEAIEQAARIADKYGRYAVGNEIRALVDK